MFMDSNVERSLCPFCKEEINKQAIKCKHCGSDLETKSKEGSLWVSIVSLILGLISILALFDESEWDKDTYIGLFTFAISGLFLGIITINQKLNGRNIAIAGIVTSSIALLLFIGLVVN